MAKEEIVGESRGRSQSKSMTTIQRRSRTCTLKRIAKPLLVLLCAFSLAQMMEPSHSAALTTESGPTRVSSSDQTLVGTSTGAVRGAVHDDFREFKGIPYAAPPTGKLRWKLPQPAKPWKGVLDATRYGSECPQLSRYGLTEAGYNEDCLFLNVTTPELRSPATVKLPVIVWIHGGAFVGGSSSLYPLAHLAVSGHLVVVSPNYRLGVFGFMGHPAFDRDYDGSYGLEDQRAAMRWVQRNIAAFGGDPGNVTIAGESAGAGSVCMHLLAPQATSGLLQKAIIQSAACMQRMHTVEESNQIGVKVAAKAGCSDQASALSCMQAKSVRQLLEAGSAVAGSDLTAFSPVVGNKSQPLQGADAMRSGKFVHAPILNGGNRNELRLYVAYDVQEGKTVTTQNYPTHLKAVYGDNAESVLAEYPADRYSSAPAALGSVMSDYNPAVGLNNCGFLQTAETASAFVKVYEYEFADPNPPPVTTDPGFEMGAVHSAELPYFFPHFSNTTKVDGPDLAPASQKLADQMVEYWTSFARSSTPSSAGSPTWSMFQSSTRVMRFELGKVGEYDAGTEHRCGFWKKLYPSLTQ